MGIKNYYVTDESIISDFTTEENPLITSEVLDIVHQKTDIFLTIMDKMKVVDIAKILRLCGGTK